MSIQQQTQKVKGHAQKAWSNMPKYFAIGLALLTFMAWFYETMKPDDVAQASEPVPVLPEGYYTPPPQPQKEPGVEKAKPEELKSSKPALTDEVKQELANTINAFSVEHGSPLGDKYGMAWVEAGIKYNKHPYALVAIAQADTSLGKSLTTPYNLGNVANTDSCPTCGNHITSWEQGIDEIAKTLANDYLGNATKLCHLSRGGWTDCPEGPEVNGGKFYASSEANWHRNSAWAQSWLHNSPVNHDYSIVLSDYYQLSVG